MEVPSPSIVLHPAELGCCLLPRELPPGLCLSNKDGSGVFLQDQNMTPGMLCNGGLPMGCSSVDDGLVERSSRRSTCCTDLCSKALRKAEGLDVLARSPVHGAEPVGTGSLAPASALDAVAKSQPSLNAKQLRGLESCPNFYSARLKMHQLAKAARRLGGELSLPKARHAPAACRDSRRGARLGSGYCFWGAKVVLPMPFKTPYVARGEPPATRWGLAFKCLPWKWERGEGNAAVPSSRALQINYSQGKELLNDSPPPPPFPWETAGTASPCPSGAMHVNLNP